VKVGGDRLQAEGEQKKIEGVERPAQEAGRERVALGPGKRTEFTEKWHRRILAFFHDCKFASILRGVELIQPVRRLPDCGESE